MAFEINPIGTVHRKETGITLKIDVPYREGLLGLELHSHIVVFWWAVGNDFPQARQTLLVHPRPLPEKEMGVYATRSPRRPNPIMSTTCQVLGVNQATGEVQIQNIDAFDQTPIIDIKCYAPTIDRVRGELCAPWKWEDPWIPEEGVSLQDAPPDSA